jgi:hypothetical protein
MFLACGCLKQKQQEKYFPPNLFSLSFSKSCIIDYFHAELLIPFFHFEVSTGKSKGCHPSV